MSYRDMPRRLEELEARRDQQERAAQQVWLDSLSDEELEVLAAEATERDPVGSAAVQALSFEDLERLVEGKMPDAEWQQHLARAQEHINAMT